MPFQYKEFALHMLVPCCIERRSCQSIDSRNLFGIGIAIIHLSLNDQLQITNTFSDPRVALIRRTTTLPLLASHAAALQASKLQTSIEVQAQDTASIVPRAHA